MFLVYKRNYFFSFVFFCFYPVIPADQVSAVVIGSKIPVLHEIGTFPGPPRGTRPPLLRRQGRGSDQGTRTFLAHGMPPARHSLPHHCFAAPSGAAVNFRTKALVLLRKTPLIRRSAPASPQGKPDRPAGTEEQNASSIVRTLEYSD